MGSERPFDLPNARVQQIQIRLLSVFFPLGYIDTKQVYAVHEIPKTRKSKRLDDFYEGTLLSLAIFSTSCGIFMVLNSSVDFSVGKCLSGMVTGGGCETSI